MDPPPAGLGRPPGGPGVFYLVEVGNYHYGGVDWPFHLKITILAAAMALTAIVCQQFVDHQRLALPARFVWGTLDSLLLLIVLLFVADNPPVPWWSAIPS